MTAETNETCVFRWLRWEKCVHMVFTKKRKPLINDYRINKDAVTTVYVYKY